MWRFNETQWKVLLKGLRFIGVAGCAVSCVSLLALIGYYSAVRPHAPDADSGWTIPLPWTGWPRAYGTAQENTVILRVFAMFFPFFVLLATASAIGKYKPERLLYLIVGLTVVVGFLIVALTIS